MEAHDIQGKRPYEKPRLRTISLVAEEVLAIGCKLPNAPGGPSGGHSCTSPKCFQPGQT